MSIFVGIFTGQITSLTNGKPFDQWNLSSLESVRDAYYNTLVDLRNISPTQEVREMSRAIAQIPNNQFTIEELCLLFLLCIDPSTLGVNSTQAEGLATVVRLSIIDKVGITERKTKISNELLKEQGTKKEIDAGTYKPPISDSEDLKGNPIITNTFSLSESIKAALKSPIVWGLFAFALYKIIKKRKKKNEQ